jgi:FtsZ-binding cell division protein ZapB
MKTPDAPNLLDNAKQTIKCLRKEKENLKSLNNGNQKFANMRTDEADTLRQENEVLQEKVASYEESLDRTLTKCATFEREALDRAEKAEAELELSIALQEKYRKHWKQAEAREKVLREALAECLNLPYEERKRVIDKALNNTKE